MSSSRPSVSDAGLAVMRKLARRGRLPAPPPGMSSQRAWRQVLPVSAEETMGLVAAVRGVEDVVSPLATALDAWQDADLHMLLRSPDGRHGLAVVEAPILSAMIECLTRGLVAGASDTSRPPTDIDAAVIGPVLNRWMTDHIRLLEEAGLPVAFAGYRAAERLEEARAAELALEDGDFQVTRIALDLDNGKRNGATIFYLPVRVSRSPDSAGKGARSNALLALVEDQTTELHAILLRRRMSLAEVRALKPGDLIDMPRDQLTRVRIEGTDGSLIARAKLGQSQGARALRLLTADPAPPNMGDERFSEVEISRDIDAAPDQIDALPDIGLDPDGGSQPMDLAPEDGDASDLGLADLPPIDGLPDLEIAGP